MSDDALRASGAWMAQSESVGSTNATVGPVRMPFERDRPAVRLDVVAALGIMFGWHDIAERDKVRRERQTGVEALDDAHAWFERVCTYAMRLATDAEIDAAMDEHQGLRYSA